VVGLANGGADTVNCIKQAAEFGIARGGQKVAALLLLLPDVYGIGLQAGQGVLLTDAFYWDLNDNTRAFGQRFAKRMGGVMPSSDQAGQYSAITNYLNAAKAIGVDRAKASGRAVVAEMRHQGARFLVFDRQSGAGQWPHLAGLLETERPPAGLRALGPLLQTDQSPANQIAIYRLE